MIYNYLISIGDFCFWADYLKHKSIRDVSLPFDWMFSNLQFVIECIDENFEPIKEYIKNKTQHGQREYIGLCFSKPSIPHHDMILEKNHQHYLRTIERWHTLMKLDSNFLFLHMSGDFLTQRKNLCKKFALKLRSKYPKLNFGILSMIYSFDKDAQIPYYIIDTEENKIACCDIHYITIYTQLLPELGSWLVKNRHINLIDSIFDNNKSSIKFDLKNYDILTKQSKVIE